MHLNSQVQGSKHKEQLNLHLFDACTNSTTAYFSYMDVRQINIYTVY